MLVCARVYMRMPKRASYVKKKIYVIQYFDPQTFLSIVINNRNIDYQWTSDTRFLLFNYFINSLQCMHIPGILYLYILSNIISYIFTL